MSQHEDDDTDEDREVNAFFHDLMRRCSDGIVEHLLDDNLFGFTTEQYRQAWMKQWRKTDTDEFPMTHENAVGHLHHSPLVVESSPDVWDYPPLSEEEMARSFNRVWSMIQESNA